VDGGASAHTWLAAHPPWTTVRVAPHALAVVVQSVAALHGAIALTRLARHEPPDGDGAAVTMADLALALAHPFAHVERSGTVMHTVPHWPSW
jgi:hypothetical protein